MNMFRKEVIVCLLIAVSVTSAKNGTSNKDVIGFPESEENPNLKNKENRQPVYLPATCPTNELFYPGDQKDDWICDCRPSHIYHPPTDSCWPAFRRGPCLDKHYLVLPQNSVIPVCQANPCAIDGFVIWNGKCERLGSVNPCSHLFPIPAAIGVNATTMVVSCVHLSLESRFGDNNNYVNINVNNLPCPPGCRRSVNGKCVPITF